MNHLASSRFIELFLLALIICWGLMVRIDDLVDWQARPEVAFLGGEPLLATGDGYYYLDLAKDLVNNSYTSTDEMRAVPTGFTRPMPPPLLAVVTAFVHRIMPFSLNWIAVILPTFLALTLAIPLYGLGHQWGGKTMALVAVAIGLASNAFVARSCLGKYDTDCLNVTFSLSIAYSCLMFAMTTGRKRYIHATVAVTLGILFLWWWGQAPVIVAGLFLFPALIALFFFCPPHSEKKKLAWGGCVGLTLVILFFFWPEPIKQTFATISSYYHYIFADGNAQNGFPSMSTIISEQRDLSFDTIVARSTNSLPLFVLSFAGLIWLFRDKPKEAMFIAPIVALALLSFVGERFMIFLAPVIAIGTGYLLIKLKKFTVNNRLLNVTVAPLFVGFFLWQSFIGGASFASPFPPQTIAGMEKIRSITQSNAVVWTPCDNGYPTMYWAERATVCDGQLHGGARSVYNAIPLATENPRLAANFIRFYMQNGPEGIEEFFQITGNQAQGLTILKQILTAGPQHADALLQQLPKTVSGVERDREQWLRFFFPLHLRPAYLYIDWGQMLANYWLGWLGSWDINKGAGESALPGKIFHHITIADSVIHSNSGSMRLNTKDGIITLKGGEKIPLSQLTVRKNNKRTVYNYQGCSVAVGKIRGSYQLDVFTEQRFALLMGRRQAKQLINSFFWLNSIPPSQYFRPTLIKTPDYQLWEVGGDQFTD